MRIIIGMVTGAILVALAVIGFKYFQQQNTEQGTQLATNNGAFDEVSYFSTLRKSQPTIDGAPVDLDGLIALLPASIVASYQSIDQNAKNGAAHVKGFVLTMASNDKIGVRIDDLYLWDVASDAIAARIKGENLDETIMIAKRIDAQGMEIFGFDSLYSSFLGAAQEKALELGAVTDSGEINDFSEILAEELSLTIDDYQFSVEQTIITDLTLHPYILDLISSRADNGEIELNVGDDLAITGTALDIVDIYQTIAAWTRAFSFEDYAMYNTKAKFAMTDKELKTSMDMDFDFLGYKGYDRGDYQRLVARDITYTMDMDFVSFLPGDFREASSDDFPNLKFALAGGIEAYRFQDIRLGKIFDHLARGVMPDTSLTDLMSFGLIELDNQTYMVNGKEFYSAKKMTVDMRDFHWFIPNKINIEIDDLVYDYVNYMEEIFKMFSTEQNATSQNVGAVFSNEQMEMFNKAFAILKENDFERLTMDWDLSYDWDPQSGSFIGQHYFGLDDFMKIRVDADFTMPDYAQLVAPIGDDITKTDMSAYSKIFEEAFYFNNFTMKIADKGGVLKSFAIAVGFTELVPDAPGSNFLNGADPQDLRVTSATMMRLAAGQMPAELAPMKVYVSAAADFVSKGGTLALNIKPSTPLSAKDIDAVEDIQDPQDVIDLIGLTLKREASDTIKDPHAN